MFSDIAINSIAQSLFFIVQIDLLWQTSCFFCWEMFLKPSWRWTNHTDKLPAKNKNNSEKIYWRRWNDWVSGSSSEPRNSNRKKTKGKSRDFFNSEIRFLVKRRKQTSNKSLYLCVFYFSLTIMIFHRSLIIYTNEKKYERVNNLATATATTTTTKLLFYFFYFFRNWKLDSFTLHKNQ